MSRAASLWRCLLLLGTACGGRATVTEDCPPWGPTIPCNPPPPPPPPASTTVLFQNEQRYFNATIELGGKAYPPFAGPFLAGYVGPHNGGQPSCSWVLDTGLARHGLEIVVNRETMNGNGDWYFLPIRDTVVPLLVPGWVVTVVDTAAHVTIIPALVPCR